jgi:hypothetical protein
LRLAYGESSPSKNVTIGNPAPVVVGGSILLPFSRNNIEAGVLKSDDGGDSWSLLANLPVPKARQRCRCYECVCGGGGCGLQARDPGWEGA